MELRVCVFGFGSVASWSIEISDLLCLQYQNLRMILNYLFQLTIVISMPTRSLAIWYSTMRIAAPLRQPRAGICFSSRQLPAMADQPKFSFKTLPGYFVQDEATTDPDTFDYVCALDPMPAALGHTSDNPYRQLQTLVSSPEKGQQNQGTPIKRPNGRFSAKKQTN